jgi:imidazolonepropionase-like amidohydrolase
MLDRSSRAFVRSVPVVACLLVGAARAAEPQEAYRFVNGHWFDGDGFVAREVLVVGGLVREDAGDVQPEVVDLEGGYVLPGYGNAHSHGIGNGDFAEESSRFLERGVFYVANPNNLGARTAAARAALESSTTVDARFANGGLTSTGGHPAQIYERGAEDRALDGNAYFAIDDLEQLESRWPDILAGEPDFLKIYLERSEHHSTRRNDPAYYGKRGLDPALLPAIVERAHAARLRVSAHVTSRHDFRIAVEAGADEIAHLPLEKLEAADARLTARNHTVVVTTALSHRPADGVHDLDALHRHNLALLREAGVELVLGTDSQASIVDEVRKIASLNVFGRSELLRMLVVATPRWIFPDRDLGTPTAGSEASFVVLAENPLEDWDALEQITARYKAGQALEHSTATEQEKPGIGQSLVHTIMSRGVDEAIAEYHRLRAEKPDRYDFGEGQLDALGDALMKHGKKAEAIAIYELNHEQFPESAKARTKLAEARGKKGP